MKSFQPHLPPYKARKETGPKQPDLVLGEAAVGAVVSAGREEEEEEVVVVEGAVTLEE